MVQMSLDEAIQEAEAAIAESGYHASADWCRKARDIVLDICRSRPEFTADDIWEQLDKTGWRTHENRALGSVMREAAGNGWCQNTMRYVPSRREGRHARPIPVWKSLIYFT